MSRSEVWLCDFGSPVGHEPAYRRPAVVISHDQLNRHGIVIVLPVTRTQRGYPTHVVLDGVLPVVSYVQCELVRAVSAERLVRKVGSLDIVDQTAVDAIVRRLLAL